MLSNDQLSLLSELVSEEIRTLRYVINNHHYTDEEERSDSEERIVELEELQTAIFAKGYTRETDNEV